MVKSLEESENVKSLFLKKLARLNQFEEKTAINGVVGEVKYEIVLEFLSNIQDMDYKLHSPELFDYEEI